MPKKEANTFLHRYLKHSSLKYYLNFLSRVKKALITLYKEDNPEMLEEIEQANIECWEKAIILKNFYNVFTKIEQKRIEKHYLKTTEEWEPLLSQKSITIDFLKAQYKDVLELMEQNKKPFEQNIITFPFLILPKPINTYGELLVFPLQNCNKNIILDSQYSKSLVKHMTELVQYKVFQKVEIVTSAGVFIIYEPNIDLVSYSLQLFYNRKDHSQNYPIRDFNVQTIDFVHYTDLGYTSDSKTFSNLFYYLNTKLPKKIKNFNSKSTKYRYRKQQQKNELSNPPN